MDILICASNADLERYQLRERLSGLLAPYRTTWWQDLAALPAAMRRGELEAMLGPGVVILLLASPALFGEDASAEGGLLELLASPRRKGEAVVWVPLQSFAVSTAPLGLYPSLWDPQRPIAALSGNEQEAAWSVIAARLARFDIRATPLSASGAVHSSQIDAAPMGARTARSQRVFGFPFLVLLFLGAAGSYIAFLGNKLIRPTGSAGSAQARHATYLPDGGAPDGRHD